MLKCKNVFWFENLAEIKGYTDFIKNNYNEELITFGKEFL